MDPVAFSVFGLDVRWYGIVYVLGFLFGGWLAAKLGKERGINKEDVYDFLVYLVIAVIVGARIAHVFGALDYYSSRLIEVFYVWNGGLAFHGGLIGAVLVGLWFCKKRNIKFYDMADIFCVPLALGLAFGRIANFINGELYGKISDVPWAVEFEGVDGKRHPSQIYESLKNFFIFIVLWNLYKIKKLPSGFIFWSFIFMYSVLRFFVEFYRDWETAFIGLTWPQLVSVPLAAVSFFILYRLYRKI